MSPCSPSAMSFPRQWCWSQSRCSACEGSEWRAHRRTVASLGRTGSSRAGPVLRCEMRAAPSGFRPRTSLRVREGRNVPIAVHVPALGDGPLVSWPVPEQGARIEMGFKQVCSLDPRDEMHLGLPLGEAPGPQVEGLLGPRGPAAPDIDGCDLVDACHFVRLAPVGQADSPPLPDRFDERRNPLLFPGNVRPLV